MKLLVTGGAGFIGSNFVRRTLETRPEISITVLDSLTYAGSLENLSRELDQIQFISGDIRHKEVVDKALVGIDLVVHFAAESHNDNSLKHPDIFFDTNVLGTLNLVEAATRNGSRFHHVSTDEVFGDLDFDSTVRFTRHSPYRPSSPYAASKAASDHLVRAWVRSFGLRATISNCSNNFGPNQHQEKLIPQTISLIAAGKKPRVYGSGLNVRDWIFVDDHTDGIWSIIDNGELGQTYLLGANSERTNLHVVREILAIMGKSADYIDFVSDRPGHDRRYAIDASETTAELGWRPEEVPFEKHLPEVVKCYLTAQSLAAKGRE